QMATDRDRADPAGDANQATVEARAADQRAADGHGADEVANIHVGADDVPPHRQRTDAAVNLAAKLWRKVAARRRLCVETEPADGPHVERGQAGPAGRAGAAGNLPDVAVDGNAPHVETARHNGADVGEAITAAGRDGDGDTQTVAPQYA